MVKRPKSIIALALVLTACFGGREELSFESLRSAQSGIRVSMDFVQGEKVQAMETGPAALIGARSSLRLSNPEGVILTEETDTKNIRSLSDTELIDAILTLQNTDIQFLLNRSTNRAASLQAYFSSLETHLQEARTRLRRLEDTADRAQDDERRLRRTLRDLQNELDDAISAGEGNSATTLTKDLVDTQTRLAEAETSLIVKIGRAHV